ncbi:hypothetical protein MKY29_11395 [Psychrobacillus sp. FSL K6-2365]|uniref:hypothetical protein n=1 Tax=Psychrobacillus TaxID=1221880 RepID=UPI0008E957B0|nr:hypothetical protein [Psychrobacillus psychrodurans]MCZ8541897.1 hypothetical protein [Psychrobacillus psychrodurans]SFN10802.1 hypothetical protein SAMN05421832_11512 [Psychrobacillus psychrodurans]
MEENDRGTLYFNMSIGTLGLLIIAVGLFKYVETVGGDSSYTLLGFPLTMIYLNYLEGKAGISKKILWIKSIIAISLLIIIYIFLLN